MKLSTLSGACLGSFRHSVNILLCLDPCCRSRAVSTSRCWRWAGDSQGRLHCDLISERFHHAQAGLRTGSHMEATINMSPCHTTVS